MSITLTQYVRTYVYTLVVVVGVYAHFNGINHICRWMDYPAQLLECQLG